MQRFVGVSLLEHLRVFTNRVFYHSHFVKEVPQKDVDISLEFLLLCNLQSFLNG